MVKILLDKFPKYSIYIYTDKSIKHDSLQTLIQANKLFQIDLVSDHDALERLEFIPLSLSPLVEPSKYPFLTLLMQNLMSILVAIQASYHLVPQVYIETIGFTHTLPVFKFLGSSVITYIHYPTISSDMIKNVETSIHASFNNREIFVRSRSLRQLKLIYYKLLACCYGLAGRCADLVLVNSSWTRNHIVELWGTKDVHVVYPPCDVESFRRTASTRKSDHTPVTRATRDLKIISIGQFRPEKNHELQIEAFDMFMNSMATSSQLTLFGGCRDEGDKKRVEYLNDIIHRLELSSCVRIVTNASFDQLLRGVSEADVALHSMMNEHFGIVLLEFMAAGLITVAHNSGGPKLDIIQDNVDGFLCEDVEDFADRLSRISKMSPEERNAMKQRAMAKASKFNVQTFEYMLLDKVARFLG